MATTQAGCEINIAKYFNVYKKIDPIKRKNIKTVIAQYIFDDIFNELKTIAIINDQINFKFEFKHAAILIWMYHSKENWGLQKNFEPIYSAAFGSASIK